MIKLTKFKSDGDKQGEFILNAEMIETIEETPDTVITLTTGTKYVVKESCQELVDRIVEYKRRVYSGVLNTKDN